jgi:copper chaperone CopZ
MKNFVTALFLATSLFGNVLNLPAQETKAPQEKVQKTKKKKQTEEVVFLVNMFCENCKKKIEKNVSWEKGVTDLRIHLEEKKVTLLYDSKKTTVESLKTSIEKLGYTCEIIEPEKK